MASPSRLDYDKNWNPAEDTMRYTVGAGLVDSGFPGLGKAAVWCRDEESDTELFRLEITWLEAESGGQSEHQAHDHKLHQGQGRFLPHAAPPSPPRRDRYRVVTSPWGSSRSTLRRPSSSESPHHGRYWVSL